MFRTTFLVFLIGLALTANDCGVSLENLDEFVVNYEVTVTNTSDEAVSASLVMPDVRRTQTLAPGASFTATGFKSGTGFVSVRPARDIVAELKAKRDEVVTLLDKKPLGLNDSVQIYGQLQFLNESIRAYQNESHGSLCALEFAAGKSTKTSVTVVFEQERFRC